MSQNQQNLRIPNNNATFSLVSIKKRAKIYQVWLAQTWLILGLFVLSPASWAKNQLNNHPSAYLEMHAKDPVDWQLFSKQTLKLAQTTNRPILISSGYFACHWCHVMQAENYQNPKIARLLNQHFINIKIDRELTPDLDHYLIEFSKNTRGIAGWPQHVFLTPSGYPFHAFTYLPPENFAQLLNKTHKLWTEQQQTINNLAKKAIKTPDAQQLVNKEALKQAVFKQLEANMDNLSGGLQGTSKFPNFPVIIGLLKLKDLPEDIEDWLLLTLEQMQSQENHLIDHINGGFFRYTVDPEWQTPHFEKMLYSQALGIQTYALAYQRWQRKDFFKTAQNTFQYTLKHLWNEQFNLFKSSQSALDKNGLEGGNYLFNKAQIQQRLPKIAAYLETQWQMHTAAPYELGWHPLPTEKHWAHIQKTLQAQPHDVPTDNKYLFSWNALMLKALRILNSIEANPTLTRFINQLNFTLSNHMANLKPPRALDATGNPLGIANLQDYAYGFSALVHNQPMAQQDKTDCSTSVEKSCQDLKTLYQRTVQHFYKNNTWLLSQFALLPGQLGKSAYEDDALPSASALLHCQSQVPKATLNNPIRFISYLETPQNCAVLERK